MARALPSAPAQEPEEQSKPGPSGRLLLRMPRALHAELARSAEREGISLNQFITNSLASMVGWGQPEGGSARAAGGRALSPEAERHSRLVLWALLANAVVIGLAAIVAITLLLLAWLG